MPLRELKCEACGRKFTELVKAKAFDEFVAAANAGDFTHRVFVTETEYVTCGITRYVLSLPADHKPLSDYPFMTAPWFLPPVIGEDGKARPQQVEVHSRADYKKLLKKHNIVEPLTSSEKSTMYTDGESSPYVTEETKLNDDVKKDLTFFNEMKRNKTARRKIIKESLHNRRAAGL